MRPCAHLLFTITAVGFVFIVHTAMHTYTSVVDPDWTRIQKLVQPDPYSEHGSGSTQLEIG